MSGKLFISGGGGAEASKLLDQEFVNSLRRSKVLYIPIGLKRNIIGFEECYEWITKTLGAHSQNELDIEMWTNLIGKHREDLSGFDAIYIGGASNTYRLLEILHSTHLQEKIVSFFEQGGILYGGSSGAIILGKNVATWGDDKDGFLSEDGLNLVHELSIFCHYSEETRERLTRYLQQYKLPTIALPENSGFIYEPEKDKIRIIGYGSVTIFVNAIAPIILKPNKEFIFKK